MTDLERSPRLQRLSRHAAGFVGGTLLGLVATVVAWRFLAGEPAIPLLSRTEWDQAVARWEAAKVLDYEIEITVSGRQPAIYTVTVENGQALGAQRDGTRLPQERTWSTWTVDGMFETIARDLDSVERHATGRATTSTPQLQLRAAFHPRFGYPERYLRSEMVRFGSNPEVTWKVTRFSQTSATREPAAR